MNVMSKLSLIIKSLCLCVALAGTDDHRYKQGEHVELWVNKVRAGGGSSMGHSPFASVIIELRIQTMLTESS